MANSKVVRTIPVILKSDSDTGVTCVDLTYDTATDFELQSAVAGKSIVVVGYNLPVTGAHDVIFKTATTEICRLSQGAKHTFTQPIGSVVVVCKVGEALNINCTNASGLSKATIFLQVVDKIQL